MLIPDDSRADLMVALQALADAFRTPLRVEAPDGAGLTPWVEPILDQTAVGGSSPPTTGPTPHNSRSPVSPDTVLRQVRVRIPISEASAQVLRVAYPGGLERRLLEVLVRVVCRTALTIRRTRPGLDDLDARISDDSGSRCNTAAPTGHRRKSNCRRHSTRFQALKPCWPLHFRVGWTPRRPTRSVAFCGV